MFTIKNDLNGELIVNKSRFITYVYKVNNVLEVNEKIDALKAKYKDATHYCYSYIIDNIKRFTEQELRNVFLYRVERKVKNDSTVSIDKEIYEVPSKYIGSKLYIRYDPTNNEEAFIFSENGERLERIVKVNKIDNSKLKRGSKKEAVDFSPFSDNKEVN